MVKAFLGCFVEKKAIKANQLEELISQVKKIKRADQIGAITSFIGTVRSISLETSKAVQKMEVEVWEDKGEEIMTNIAGKVAKKFNLLAIRLLHVYGDLCVGDPIVFIVLASIHRKEAFKGLEAIIRAYKDESPVWKKEVYEDGDSKWIETAKKK